MALVTFLVMHATPGSPLDPVAEGANPLSPEAQKNLAEVYGLDKPLYAQFGIFLSKAIRGDFGTSFVYKTRTVTEIMKETFPISLLLGSMALALAIVGGVSLGILAAVYQNRSWDYVSVSVATLGVSVPNFVLAVFLIVIFSFVLPIFPTGGWNSPKDWVLPTITLALAVGGIIVMKVTQKANSIHSPPTTSGAVGCSASPIWAPTCPAVQASVTSIAGVPTARRRSFSRRWMIPSSMAMSCRFARASSDGRRACSMSRRASIGNRP